EEELRADLLIRLPGRGEPRDLLFLCSELAACLVTALAHLLAGREQLAARALGKRVGAEAAEHLISGAELFPCVRPAVLTPQPLPVDQVGAGKLRPERRAAEPSDRLEIQRLRCLALAHQCPRARHDPESPLGVARARGLHESSKG